MKLRNKKTGEIKSIEEIIRQAFLYNDLVSLKSIGSNWEDVGSTNNTNIPLIKDEKVRKVVRAWAEANDIKEIIVFDNSNNAPYTPVGAVDFAENGSHLEIRFRTEERFDTDRRYTIEELCGSEEIEILEPTYTTIEEKEKLKEKE